MGLQGAFCITEEEKLTKRKQLFHGLMCMTQVENENYVFGFLILPGLDVPILKLFHWLKEHKYINFFFSGEE